MLKIEKEYNEKYGDIPTEYDKRIEMLNADINFKRQVKTIDGEVKRIKNIKWKKESFIIYLLPKPTPRPRSGKNGIFYVKGAKDNKKYFEKYLLNKDVDIICTPTKFSCKSYFPIPKSMNKIERVLAEMGFIRPISKPDWDNVAKAYCDMIQGFLIYDDSLIIDGTSSKYYSLKPRIEITIEYMEDFDSDFNRKKMKKKG